MVGHTSERKFGWKAFIVINNLLIVIMDVLLLVSEVKIGSNLVPLAHELTQAFTVHLSTVKYFILTKYESKFEEIAEKLELIRGTCERLNSGLQKYK